MPVLRGSPSFCWQCNRLLRIAKSDDDGVRCYYGITVRDKGGADHRIHGDCLPDAKADGCKLVFPSLEASPA
jgi:hypothetical protein